MGGTSLAGIPQDLKHGFASLSDTTTHGIRHSETRGGQRTWEGNTEGRSGLYSFEIPPANLPEISLHALGRTRIRKWAGAPWDPGPSFRGSTIRTSGALLATRRTRPGRCP